MANRQIIRGDSYQTRQPFRKYTILDSEGAPMNLVGCTVMTTYKPDKTDAQADPFDSGALRHHMIVNGSGVVTSSSGLALETTAAAGVVIETLTAAETLSLPADTILYSDVQVIDANGEVTTSIMADTIEAVDAYTNRQAVA